MKEQRAARTARVVSVQESFVQVGFTEGVPVTKNEVGYILVGDERLRAEVLRVQGDVADMQVFEDTRGVRVGDTVELSGEMLSVALGPGLLGSVFDGLQTPLEALAREHGYFLPRGVQVPALDPTVRWRFEPRARVGARVLPGDVLGTTREGHLEHRVLVPLVERGPLEVVWIEGGSVTVEEPVAGVRREDGSELELTLQQRWPVRRPLPERLLREQRAVRLYPDRPLITSQRIIDTFFPVALGGTACIPGPFGAGKTVLQSLIARHAAVDVVVIIACGERAGEVVETIQEYPRTPDPRTGGSLMDRTVIVCNTSSMPVAARESSIYTGVTIGEYYRQMGHHVLCIADSTSRWAQAMRETSGRMEEIPGEEAFPAYLDSTIKGLYERAGVLRVPGGQVGSLTLIGTVSPAGGNFDEPVTQATLGTVKTFLGLSAERAYRRYFPAIDPLTSWSRYLDQLGGWFREHQGTEWGDTVRRLTDLLRRGETIHRTMQVVGEEGTSLQDFVTWQKAVLVDMVYLQQDAFDPVDSAASLERQRTSLELVRGLVEREYAFDGRDEAREVFTQLTHLMRNRNYRPEGPAAAELTERIQQLARDFAVEDGLSAAEGDVRGPAPGGGGIDRDGSL